MTTIEKIVKLVAEHVGFSEAAATCMVLKEFRPTEQNVVDYGTWAKETLENMQKEKD